MENFPKTLAEAFEKLDQETKDVIFKVVNENHGIPSFFRAIKEFLNTEKSKKERDVYFLFAVTSLMARMAEEHEEDGKLHQYEVALCCGGVMEDPNIHYEDHQIIEAHSRAEAKETYDKRNNCSYYYGEVLRQID